MAFLGPAEIILIIVVIAIFFFGKDKVLAWARTVGEAKKEFKEGTKAEPKKQPKRKQKRRKIKNNSLFIKKMGIKLPKSFFYKKIKINLFYS